MVRKRNERFIQDENTTEKKEYKCIYCNETNQKEFYNVNNDNMLFADIGYMPICKSCIIKLYNKYYLKYKEDNIILPEQKAVERVCMFLNLYFSEDAFVSCVKANSNNIIQNYIRIICMTQYNKKTYDTNLLTYNNEFNEEARDELRTDNKVKNKTVKFFGQGFKEEDYLYLQEQYDDWTARHECKTKAQEEVFKQICFTQLELLKATRNGEDTKDLTATFQKLLETAKLQPKQNSGDTTSETQTLGTLINKWENTRPIPECDPELQDVDRIGLYIDTFFRGHLAKMMGLKNGLSNLYDNFMKKYTVEKPEYADDESSEVLFDAIFGEHESNDVSDEGGGQSG